MIIAQIHIQKAVVVEISHGCAVRSVRARHPQAACTRNTHQIATVKPHEQFVFGQSLGHKQIFVSIVVQVHPIHCFGLGQVLRHPQICRQKYALTLVGVSEDLPFILSECEVVQAIVVEIDTAHALPQVSSCVP